MRRNAKVEIKLLFDLLVTFYSRRSAMEGVSSQR